MKKLGSLHNKLIYTANINEPHLPAYQILHESHTIIEEVAEVVKAKLMIDDNQFAQKNSWLNN